MEGLTVVVAVVSSCSFTRKNLTLEEESEEANLWGEISCQNVKLAQGGLVTPTYKATSIQLLLCTLKTYL